MSEGEQRRPGSWEPALATSKATRRPAQQARKTTPTARQSADAHASQANSGAPAVTQSIRNPRAMPAARRLLTTLQSTRKYTSYRPQPATVRQQDPPPALTARAPRSPARRRRSPRTKGQAAGTERTGRCNPATGSELKTGARCIELITPTSLPSANIGANFGLGRSSKWDLR
jgi:hypothetical protein